MRKAQTKQEKSAPAHLLEASADGLAALNIPYFQSPNEIFDQGLTAEQISVYLYLCRCSNQGSTAFPSYQTIGERCGMSRSTALRVVKRLVSLGWLIKTTRPPSIENKHRDHWSNIYAVVLPSIELAEQPPPSVIELAKQPPPSVTVTPPSVTVTPPSVTVTPYKELPNNNYSETTTQKEKRNNKFPNKLTDRAKAFQEFFIESNKPSKELPPATAAIVSTKAARIEAKVQEHEQKTGHKPTPAQHFEIGSLIDAQIMEELRGA